MKKSSKIVTLLCLATAATGAIHIINKSIFMLAEKMTILPFKSGNNYSWRFGNVFYTKQGSGSPLLLIHDISSFGSGSEWDSVVTEYSKTHTVYTIDLLGCGRSEKPSMTYTNFLYVQLISDFVREVIGSRTHVITSGSSSAIVTMSCLTDNSLFDKIIFVNPLSIAGSVQVPTHRSRLAKFLLDIPIIGTLLYNFFMSKSNIEKSLKDTYFTNPYKVQPSIINAFYEAAHKSGASSKFICSSIVGKYTTANIIRGLKAIDNNIYIIYGEDVDDIDDIIEDYTNINPIIETASVSDSKLLPHMECVDQFIENTNTFL